MLPRASPDPTTAQTWDGLGMGLRLWIPPQVYSYKGHLRASPVVHGSSLARTLAE